MTIGRAIVLAIGTPILAALTAAAEAARRLDGWASIDETGRRRLLLARASAATAIVDKNRKRARVRRLARRLRRRERP